MPFPNFIGLLLCWHTPCLSMEIEPSTPFPILGFQSGTLSLQERRWDTIITCESCYRFKSWGQPEQRGCELWRVSKKCRHEASRGSYAFWRPREISLWTIINQKENEIATPLTRWVALPQTAVFLFVKSVRFWYHHSSVISCYYSSERGCLQGYLFSNKEVGLWSTHLGF